MDFPIRSSRTSVETREREPGSRDDRRGDEVCFAATHVFHPRPPACHRSRGRQGQALRVAAKSAAILDRHSTRWRSRTAVGAEEWLRRGQTKEWVRKQFSCQDFVITIRKGRHQFSWHKKQEHSRIFPSDTVVVLTRAPSEKLNVLGLELEKSQCLSSEVHGRAPISPISGSLQGVAALRHCPEGRQAVWHRRHLGELEGLGQRRV